MKSDWLAASSFERTHETISAINTLSIHTKLTLANVSDPVNAADLESARQHVITFLDRLRVLVEDAKAGQGGAVVRADPQLGELAARYLLHNGGRAGGPSTSIIPVPLLMDLVHSTHREDMELLVEHLRTLRTLLEQYAHNDLGTFEEV